MKKIIVLLLTAALVLSGCGGAGESKAPANVDVQALYTQLEGLGLPEMVDVGGNRYVGNLYFRMARNLPIYETTAQYKGKALVVFGEKDEVVKQEAAEKYMDGFEDGKFLLYPTLNHGLGGDEQEEMAREVISFLTEA